MIVNFVWPSSAQYTGGVVVLYEFANALARRGVDVRFIHGPKTPWRVGRVEEIAWFTFDERVQHLVVDDVDDPVIEAGDLVMAPAAPERLGLPVAVIQGHGMMPTEWERQAFRSAGLKVVVASWLRDVGARYGVPAERFATVPVGIDHDRFTVDDPAAARPIDVVLLYNRHPAKGWTVGLEAIERVRSERPDLRVVVFGIVEPSHDLPDWIEYVVAPDRDVLARDVLNRAKVMVQPSWYEGLGLGAIEAMACGCALVTTDNGGCRDYAEDGVTARVCPPGDAAGLAEAVLALLADDDERDRLAAAGSAAVRRYDWDRAGDLLVEALRSYLADPDRFRGELGPDLSEQGPAVGGVGDEELLAAVRRDVERDQAEREARKAPTSLRRALAGGEVREEDLVWNVVWTGAVFDRLRYFVASQMAHSRSRFRFVANGCADGEVEKMEAFRARHPDRVVEVLEVFDDMLAHGQALDAVLDQRDDGSCFCLIDPDIKASGPFATELLALLPGHGAVTSGKEIWNRDSLLPVNHPGIAGEHFFDPDGFVYGSPHLAIYDRAALEEVRERWKVGLGSAGPELSPEAVEAMEAIGRHFKVFDTAKIVNILLTAGGRPIIHRDVASLLHIGGLSHYISPSSYITLADGQVEPEWARWDIVAPRLEVARYTARLLTSAIDGSEPAPMPDVADDHLRAVVPTVRDEVLDLVDRYRSWMPSPNGSSTNS